MTADVQMTMDWQAWLRRWDAQQTGYLPDREERFTAMLDVLEVLLPEEFVAVDLACGPGSISQRLLARFPRARSVAVDLDPIMLTLGKGALGTVDGRLRWVEANLAGDDWPAKLGEEQVDAVLSTTALHWLSGTAILGLYRRLGQLIRPGGVFLNGDNMAFAPHLETFASVSTAVRERQQAQGFAGGAEDSETWWKAFEAEAALKQQLSLHEQFAERWQRFPARLQAGEAPIYDLHEAALRNAGFREVGVIWQRMGNRVLMGVR